MTNARSTPPSGSPEPAPAWLWLSREGIIAGCTPAARVLGIADPAGLSQMPHIDYVREAGSEGIELVMWLIARGAMSNEFANKAPKVAHRFYHVPASNTAVGHLILENQQ